MTNQTPDNVWTAEDGKRSRVSEMSLTHLQNVLDFLTSEITKISEELRAAAKPIMAGCAPTPGLEEDVCFLQTRKLMAHRWRNIIKQEITRRDRDVVIDAADRFKRGFRND